MATGKSGQGPTNARSRRACFVAELIGGRALPLRAEAHDPSARITSGTKEFVAENLEAVGSSRRR